MHESTIAQQSTAIYPPIRVLTVVNGETKQPLQKIHTVSFDGQFQKGNAPQASYYWAQAREVHGLVGLKAVLDQGDTTLILQAPPESELKAGAWGVIVSKDRLRELLRDENADTSRVHHMQGYPVFTRTKAVLQPQPDGWGFLMFDFDPHPDAPGSLQFQNADDWWQVVLAAVPELAGCGFVETRSASDGIVTFLGDPISNSPSVHRYILTRNLTAENLKTFRKTLQSRLDRMGLSVVLNVKDVHRNIRPKKVGLIDTSTLDTARLNYEAEPILPPGFARNRVESRLVQGDHVLDLATITPEKAEHKQEAKMSNAMADGVAEVNASNSLITLLESYGYGKKGEDRYLFPGSQTGAPGVIVYHDQDGDRVFSHHDGDPLCTGYPLDYFRAWARLQGISMIQAYQTLYGYLNPDQNTALRPEYFKDQVMKGDQMKPIPTTENYEMLCNHHGFRIWFDQMKKRFRIERGGKLFTTWEQARTQIINWAQRAELPCAISSVDGIMMDIAFKNARHPVREWLQQLPEPDPWHDYIDELVSVFTLKPGQDRLLVYIYLKRWLISAVAAVMEPPGTFSTRGVLTMLGAQGIGKSSFFRSLVPEKGWVSEHGSLDFKNKEADAIMNATSSWIGEFSEVETIVRDAEHGALKGFITRETDTYRKPYGRESMDVPRQTVFGATANSNAWLSDSSGLTRYYVVEFEAINWQHDVDLGMLWAQVLELYRRGEPWHLITDEVELQAQANTRMRALDPIEEAVLDHFKIGEPVVPAGEREDAWTASRILTEVCGYNRGRRLSRDLHRALVILERYGQVRSDLGYGNRLYFEMPPRNFEDSGKPPFTSPRKPGPDNPATVLPFKPKNTPEKGPDSGGSEWN